MKACGIVLGLLFACLGAAVFFSPKDLVLKETRVVALAPSYCENMHALGLSHLLVGVSSHCEGLIYEQLPKVGSFLEPNFEAIVALNPSLVLAVPHPMAQNVLQLLATRSEIFARQPDSLADIYEINRVLARKFGVEEQGEKIAAEIKNALLNSPKTKKATFLFAVSPAPLVVAGKNTFASEILEAMGLVNLAQKPIAWPLWPLESLLNNPPDILIIESSENLASYQNLLRTLGIDYVLFPQKYSMSQLSLLIPNRPLFQSPSPKIIEDINYLSKMLKFNL